jgi:CheY-like chemotaxis protein
MRRAVLIADADCASCERIARIARDAGYRVVEAHTPSEAFGALDACPISAVIIDERLLGRCDLGRLLRLAPTLVLSRGYEAGSVHDIAIISKDASEADLLDRIAGFAGHPNFSGARDIVPFPFAAYPAPILNGIRARSPIG